MEFAVGLGPARQLCAQRSFVLSAARADGGRTRQGFHFSLFLLDPFPPSSQLYSEHPPPAITVTRSFGAFEMHTVVLGGRGQGLARDGSLAP